MGLLLPERGLGFQLSKHRTQPVAAQTRVRRVLLFGNTTRVSVFSCCVCAWRRHRAASRGCMRNTLIFLKALRDDRTLLHNLPRAQLVALGEAAVGAGTAGSAGGGGGKGDSAPLASSSSGAGGAGRDASSPGTELGKGEPNVLRMSDEPRLR